MAAEAPLVFYLLLLFPFVRGSSQPSPQSDHAGAANGTIQLVTCDGDLFTVNQAVLYESGLIKEAIHNGRVGGPIKLENTTSRALDKLLHYAQNYNQTEFAVSEWEMHLKDDYKVLFELFLAGHELRMDSVYNMAAGIIGDMMKGKSPAEIRRMFDCGNDTADEMEKEDDIWSARFYYGEPEEVSAGKLVPVNSSRADNW